MQHLRTVDDLHRFRGRIMSDHRIRKDVPILVISADTGAKASGVGDIIRMIKRYMIERGLRDKLALRITGCIGFCEMNPYVVVEPWGYFYPKLTVDDVPRVIESALGGFIDDGLAYREPGSDKPLRFEEIPFFNRQQRTVIGMNQKVDPIRIINYIEQGGYDAVEQVMANPDPQRVINEVLAAGIRGRGGAGFPTGQKWQLARQSGNGSGRKYIVCNADEGDPGAYMDRAVLEGNPHAVIEGLIIGAVAIGADKGLIYVRSEYPLAIKHLQIALRQARELGLLGDNILGTGITFDIQVIRGAGAFVCGEETSLIRSVEGHMGEPRQRPPYPIQKGVYGYPTCINNVETLANIPIIIKMGGAAYAKVGVPKNTGTKIFSLVGKIRNTGLVEVPLGTKIADVVYDIGGGAVGKARIKAVQTGGPSGGCIPASLFNLSIDYDSLARAGSIMGSGGMIVMDDNTCMVDVAKYFMNFLRDESCGKCFTCRDGTQRMYEILEDISNGTATLEHLDLLEELALVVRDTSMCGLGQSAANPVLSMLRYFRRECEEHITAKKCSAYVCNELVGAPCQSACPLGTEAWRYIAHIGRAEYEDAYRAIREANPFPSVCARVCHHPCEDHCRAAVTGGDPLAIRALKRFVTDRIDPSAYTPTYTEWTDGTPPRIAIVGSGPAGLTAAHYLSLKGYRVTLLEKEDELGGMLYCAIPHYRLPRTVIQREIESLIDHNIEVKCNAALGEEVSVDALLEDGYAAVLIAIGAHKSKPLELENETVPGVYPSIEFLKAFNMRGEQLARGNVGVIGGGNSAIDAARMALRQKDVSTVTIFYRRTEEEMPAIEEEIEAAQQEGIQIRTLVTPVEVLCENGRLAGIVCLKNTLGDADASGRRRPIATPGTERHFGLDTLIVAIGEDSGIDAITPAKKSGIAVTKRDTVAVDTATLQTNRPGVFAAGDVVTGPNTVVEAIAAGKKAAAVIDRYVRGEALVQPAAARLPRVYVEPVTAEQRAASKERIETPRAPADWRKRNFSEVEVALSVDEATREAHRCLRCDLEFVTRARSEAEVEPVEVLAGGTQQ